MSAVASRGGLLEGMPPAGLKEERYVQNQGPRPPETHRDLERSSARRPSVGRGTGGHRAHMDGRPAD